MASAPHSSAWPAARAPGKVILAGEYAVLFGAPSLVMAVDRHIVLRGEDPGPPDPLSLALLEEAARHASIPGHVPLMDDRAFRTKDGAKLGLGSSAAKAAALLTSAFALAGEDVDSEDVRGKVLRAALRAHRRAGGGSGVDVAASVLGGVVKYRLAGSTWSQEVGSFADKTSPQEASRVSVEATRLPLLVHGGSPVSTRVALERLEERLRAERDPVWATLRAAGAAAEAIVESLTQAAASASDLTKAVDEAAHALAAISSALRFADEPGSDALLAAAKVARRFEGAAKQSGAGAGDLILVFVPTVDPDDRGLVAAALDKAGLDVLHLGIDDRGAHPG